MTAKKKGKKVMEVTMSYNDLQWEKRPSLPEVVTVRNHLRIPGATLNRLSISFVYILCFHLYFHPPSLFYL